MHINVTDHRVENSFFLSAFWLTGLAIGLSLAYHLYIKSMMPGTAVVVSKSIFGSFILACSPLVLAFIFIRYRWRVPLFTLCFVKALLFGFGLLTISLVNQSICFLFLLTQSCCCILMFLISLWNYTDKAVFVKRSIIFLIAFIVIFAVEQLLILILI